MGDAIFTPFLTFTRPSHQYHNNHAILLEVVPKKGPYFPQGTSSYAQAERVFYREVYAPMGFSPMQYAKSVG
jgi:hypothetical protein